MPSARPRVFTAARRACGVDYRPSFNRRGLGCDHSVIHLTPRRHDSEAGRELGGRTVELCRCRGRHEPIRANGSANRDVKHSVADRICGHRQCPEEQLSFSKTGFIASGGGKEFNREVTEWGAGKRSDHSNAISRGTHVAENRIRFVETW